MGAPRCRCRTLRSRIWNALEQKIFLLVPHEVIMGTYPIVHGCLRYLRTTWWLFAPGCVRLYMRQYHPSRHQFVNDCLRNWWNWCRDQNSLSTRNTVTCTPRQSLSNSIKRLRFLFSLIAVFFPSLVNSSSASLTCANNEGIAPAVIFTTRLTDAFYAVQCTS